MACHYCKEKQLAEQSNNLCVDCLNAIVKFYAGQEKAQDHYLETLLMGLKPEPLEKLYIKALYMSNLDYCQDIIKFYEKGREDGQSRGQTTKNRLPGDSRKNTERRGSSPHFRRDEKHLGRNKTQNAISYRRITKIKVLYHVDDITEYLDHRKVKAGFASE